MADRYNSELWADTRNPVRRFFDQEIVGRYEDLIHNDALNLPVQMMTGSRMDDPVSLSGVAQVAMAPVLGRMRIPVVDPVFSYAGEKATRLVGWELGLGARLGKVFPWMYNTARRYREIPTRLSNAWGRMADKVVRVGDRVKGAQADLARKRLAQATRAMSSAESAGVARSGSELSPVGKRLQEEITAAQAKLDGLAASPVRPAFTPKPPRNPATRATMDADDYMRRAGKEEFGASTPFRAMVKEWVKQFPRNHSTTAGWGSAGIVAAEAAYLTKSGRAIYDRVFGNKAERDQAAADAANAVRDSASSVAKSWSDATNRVSSLSDAAMLRDVLRKSFAATRNEIVETSGGNPDSIKAIEAKGLGIISNIYDSASSSGIADRALEEAEAGRDAWVDREAESGYAVESLPGETYESYRGRKAAEFDKMTPIGKILTVE